MENWSKSSSLTFRLDRQFWRQKSNEKWEHGLGSGISTDSPIHLKSSRFNISSQRCTENKAERGISRLIRRRRRRVRGVVDASIIPERPEQKRRKPLSPFLHALLLLFPPPHDERQGHEMKAEGQKCSAIAQPFQIGSCLFTFQQMSLFFIIEEVSRCFQLDFSFESQNYQMPSSP